MFDGATEAVVGSFGDAALACGLLLDRVACGIKPGVTSEITANRTCGWIHAVAARVIDLTAIIEVGFVAGDEDVRADRLVVVRFGLDDVVEVVVMRLGVDGAAFVVRRWNDELLSAPPVVLELGDASCGGVDVLDVERQLFAAAAAA